MFKDIATPFYVYDLDGLRQRAKLFKKSMPKNGHAHYAMKANSHPQILKVLREEGFGADVVSLGEMQAALEAGFDSKDIVFSGVGKTVKEIEAALQAKISQINVESVPELERIIACAKKMGVRARVAFRMNPDVDANTHPYIRTGFRDNKFGLDFSETASLMSLCKNNEKYIDLCGLTLHIGSQIRETEPFAAAIRKTLDLYNSFNSSGFRLTTLDVGGGLGIDYSNDGAKTDEELILKYMKVVSDLLSGAVDKIYFEPGRILVARFGSLVTEVQYIKRTPYKNFIIVDTGMHHLLRPALYQAEHRIDVFNSESSSDSHSRREIFDIVGPICESSDVLGRERYLSSSVHEGDRLVIFDTGAYGAVMSSQYNLHPAAREVCISKGRIL